jgi:hypothetical protein
MPGPTRPSRIERARHRARSAKVALAAGCALVFGASFLGARAYAPGHAKGRTRSLAAPSSFERAVRHSALAGGQIAPPQAPPTVKTSAS